MPFNSRNLIANTIKTFSAVILLGTISHASAGTFYIGGGYGKSDTSIGAGDTTTGYITHSRWATAGKAFVGYQFTDYLGGELNYFQTAGIPAGTGDTGKVRIYALELSAVGFFPINQQFRLGGSAGVYRDAFHLQNLTAANYPDGINHNPNETTGVGFGLFAEYMVVQNAYVRFGFDQLVGRAHGDAMKISPQFYTLSLSINLGNGDTEDTSGASAT